MENMFDFMPGDRVTPILGAIFEGGKSGVVKEVIDGGRFLILEGQTCAQPASHYKKVEEKIVITTDGRTARATYSHGCNVPREVTLTRHLDDNHDMKKLAAYAVQKLFPADGQVITVRKAGYQGAVCVVNSKSKVYTDGRILEFVGGQCTNPPDQCAWILPKFDTLDELKAWAKRRDFEAVELHRR